MDVGTRRSKKNLPKPLRSLSIKQAEKGAPSEVQYGLKFSLKSAPKTHYNK